MFVKVAGDVSEPKAVTSGVPQENVLGLFCF